MGAVSPPQHGARSGVVSPAPSCGCHPRAQAAWVPARAARADPGGLRVLPLPQRGEGRGPGHPLAQRLRGREEQE